MRKTRILLTTLLALIMIAMSLSVSANDESAAVYYECIGGFYYHVDPVCPIANKGTLPMISVSRFLLSQEPYRAYRPCMFCLPLESEEYYEHARGKLTDGEIAEQKYYDGINLRLLDRDNFTFEDWADLYPGTFVLPSASDISAEEALDIAREGLISVFSIDRDTVIKCNASILCTPAIDFEDNNEKIFLIQFGTEEYPLLYNVYVEAWSGKIQESKIMCIPPETE